MEWGGGCSFTRDFERKERFCFIRGIFRGGSGRYVKRFWKRTSLSLGASLGNLEMGLFTGDSDRQMKEGFGSGASVPVEVLREKPGGKTPLQGTLKDT